MVRRILKIAAWIVGGVVGLCLAVYLLAVAVNWRDREPSAAAVRAAELYRDRPPVSDEDNAFVYVMGLDVAPDEDPRRMGLARVAWLQSASNSSPLDASKDPLGKRHDFRAGRDPAVQEFLDACKPVDAKCPVAFDSAQAIFDQWTASEPWLTERYGALTAHTGWRETVPSGLAAPFPTFQSPLDGQKLLLLKAKMLAGKGDHAGVKELLANDLRFWRMVLASSDLLISKMIATAAITRHFEMGNLVLRDFEPGSAANAVPPEWHVGISDAERSMLRCMVGEWVYSSGILKSEALGSAAERDGSFVERAVAALTVTPFYQEQDSLNKHAEYLLSTAESLNVPLSSYETAVNKVKDELERRPDGVLPPRTLYNLIGQVLFAMGGDYGQYARRVGDIEGVRRAALAAVTLREAKVNAREMGAALSTLPIRNPYNDRPFQWDPNDGAIVFQGLETRERGVHRIYY